MLYDIYQVWFLSLVFFSCIFSVTKHSFKVHQKIVPPHVSKHPKSDFSKQYQKAQKIKQEKQSQNWKKKKRKKKVANQLAPNSMLKILKIMLIMKISSPIDLHNPEDFRTIITKKGKKTHWIKNLFKPHLWTETQQEKQLVPSVSWAQYLQWVGIEAKRLYIKSNIHRIFSRRGTCETVTSWVSFECNNGSFPLEAKMFCGHSPY